MAQLLPSGLRQEMRHSAPCRRIRRPLRGNGSCSGYWPAPTCCSPRFGHRPCSAGLVEIAAARLPGVVDGDHRRQPRPMGDEPDPRSDLSGRGGPAGRAVRATLFADMGAPSSLPKPLLQATLHVGSVQARAVIEVALSTAAAWLALPRHWGLTAPGAAVGGGHAGYRLCLPGWPGGRGGMNCGLPRALCEAVGLQDWVARDVPGQHPCRHRGLCAGLTQRQLSVWRPSATFPLHTLPGRA